MRVALLLAGGEGRRFGKRDKLLERIGGEPVLTRSLRAARAAGKRTILILPLGFGRRRALAAQLRWPGLVVRTARGARDGIGGSLAEGLAALRPIDREAIIFLADMPFARACRGRLAAGVDALRPRREREPGHPLLVRASALDGLKISSETGLAGQLDKARVVGIRGVAGNFLDVDTPAALRRLRYRIATRAGAFRIADKERRC